MSKKHENDISIGSDLWIICEEPKEIANAVNIDYLMDSLVPMWKALETECVSGCCGIDAYNLWESEVLQNTEGLDRESLVTKLGLLRKDILNIREDVVRSILLNNYFTKGTFLKVIEHLLRVYDNA